MTTIKSRFTATDVKSMVRDLRSTLLGQRVANVYDLTDKIYLFKFAIPGSSEKLMLLLESGIRFHTTKYARDKNDMPSPFAMKLRKYIRTKRLEDIRQLGSDRVVDFKFGSGDSVCHIILELYASGNIVLTDGAYEIQALLRSHQFADDVAVKMHEIYPIAFTTSLDSLSINSSNESSQQSILNMNKTQFIEWALQRDRLNDENNNSNNGNNNNTDNANNNNNTEQNQSQQNDKKSGGNKKNKARKMTLKQLFLCKESGIASYGPEIIENCILTSGLLPSTKVFDLFQVDSPQYSLIDNLLNELNNGSNLLTLLNTPGQSGYILTRPKKLNNDSSKKVNNGENSGENKTETIEYYDFIPRRFLQHNNDTYIEFPSFDTTVDEYFCKVEEQRLQQQAVNAEETAMKKVNKVKAEMENQLKGLITQQEKMELSATLVELYAEDIDKACLVINSALSAGVAWNDIDSMVATETAKGNPIASLVSRVLYQKNHMIIKLPNLNHSDSSNSDSDSDSDTDKEINSDVDEKNDDNHNNNKHTKNNKNKNNNKKNNKNKKQQKQKQKDSNQNFVEVEIDLALSAYANAAKLYSNKKVAKVKEIKTAQASEKAIDAVEQQTYKQLESQRMKRNLQAIRKVHWFEKFNWFITSEGYLVLSGRDAQQNEALVKKYLRPGDAYVHADMHGASSCIVRAKLDTDSKPLPISPFALQEAGTMTICRSGAWNVKVVMSAWWVYASQVSKTAPTGEYLTTGSFMIYGRKNFLPPTNLEMGFGIMFRLDDSSVTRHLGERKDKLVDIADDESTISTMSDLSERYNIDMTPSIPILTTNITNITNTTNNLGNQDINNEKAKARINRRAQRALEKNQTKNSNENIQSTTTTQPESQINDNLVENNIEDTIEDTIDEIEKIENSNDNKTNNNNKNNKTNNNQNNNKKSNNSGNTNKNTSSKNQKKGVVTKDNKDEDSDSDNDNNKKDDNDEKNSGFKKKKAPNKKKARRYAHQDEEDLELAMQALGHQRPGGGGIGTLSERQNKEAEEKKAKEKQQKQAKAGVHLLAEDWSKSLDLLHPEVKSVFEGLINSGQMKYGEIDSFEISTLASFESNHGVEILRLFNEDGNLSNVKNKSGFLAGIMRRYSSTLSNPSKESLDENENSNNNQLGTQDEISRRERKKKEQMEIQAILEDEGILDEMEGKQADELEKLTGTPLPEDLLLYAVPVCGPYKALQSMKYVVKLTPGTNKKGKAAKQAVEIFMNSKDCSNNEKTLIKGLTDPEMVAIMIGDVKLSVPGLYSTLKNKKVEKKKSAKDKIKSEE